MRELFRSNLMMLIAHKYSLVVLLITSFCLVLTSNTSMFASPDDYCTFATRFFEDGCSSTSDIHPVSIIDRSVVQATGQGRFYQVFYYTLTQLVFVLNSPVFVYLVRTLSIIFLLHSLYLFSTKIVTKKVAIWVPIAFSATYSVATGYNAITGFPLWFTFGQFMFLYGMAFFGDLLRAFKLRESLLFTFFFAIGISSYEAVLFQIPTLVIALLLSQKPKELNWKRFLIKQEKAPLYLLFGVVGVYLLGYYLFAKQFGGSYQGTILSLDDPFGTISAVFLMSFGHLLNTAYLNLHLANFSSYSFYIAIAGLCVFVLLFIARSRELVPAAKKDTSQVGRFGLTINSWPIFVTIFLGSFLPNLPLALTERYREWAQGQPLYLGTFYSACLQSIALAILFHFLISSKSLLRGISSLFAVTFVTAATIVSNAAIFTGQQSTTWIYQAVTESAKEFSGRQVGPVSPVVDYSALENYVGTGSYRFWDAYIFESTGITFHDSRFIADGLPAKPTLRFELYPESNTVVLTKETRQE